MRTHREEPGAGATTAAAAKATIGFLQQIHHAGQMRSAVAATDAATVVLGTLMRAVTREQARVFLSTMPSTLRHLLHGCAYERLEAPEVGGRDDVLRTIADLLRIGRDDAEVVGRIVMAAAQNWLPRRELLDLRLQLPSDVRDLWSPP
jgi:uncharacterized protein (DUF2267 family)